MQSVIDLANAVHAGERRALAKAITLVESGRADHRRKALELLEALRDLGPREAVRIGLSGTPGVGKSTFTEALGMSLVTKGLKIAVLAVDPSSTRSGGSILGDKTRMEQLARSANAFIRPSPSQTTLGGVARRSREAILLCEAAGFDVVLVETVGVGQSETMVAQMTDVFLLLLAPAGGDELQGVKRGIMEIADIILVNKADGDLKATATRTCADYAGALRLMRKRETDPVGYPMARTVSALEDEGIGESWKMIEQLVTWRRQNGVWDATRRDQALHWFQAELRDGLMRQLTENIGLREAVARIEAEVKTGHISPSVAAEQALNALRSVQ